MRQCFLFLCLSASLVWSFSRWLPPFNESSRIYELCNNEMDNVVLLTENHRIIEFYIEKYVLCYSDFEHFVPTKWRALVWFMRSLRFCDVNQIFQYNRHRQQYHRWFQKMFLRYAYALVCDKGRLLPEKEHLDLYIYSSLFNTLYEATNNDRQTICSEVSRTYSDLYSRCYVPHVTKRQRKIDQRCSSTSAPLLKFSSLFQRFSRECDSFSHFARQPQTLKSMGKALANDTVFMNLLSANLVSNIHSDSELPSLVLKTRLLLQHFSLAAVKLWKQIEEFRKCRSQVTREARISTVNDTEDENVDRVAQMVASSCCLNNHVCELQNEKMFRALSDSAWLGFKIELCLLVLVMFNTILLALLLLKTKRHLSTATVLFVFNIMFSNLLFLLSFAFFFVDLFDDLPYGPVNEDHIDKSAELVVAETLQTHLFASDEFRKHLIQETLYSLAQNGSLIGLIHLLVLVLVVISRSMAGASVHISRLAVVSLFAAVWLFLFATHIMFSTMQISAIENLDELFATLSKGRLYLACGGSVRSGYEEIAGQCDRTAVFHAFGAYLLRGHTLFTLLFLTASIVIFTVTIMYHMKVKREYEFVHSGIRDHSPHLRRERLFNTLILSIATFFVSVLGQTYIEIAVFWVEDRGDVARLTKWYHLARIAAFVDPVLNPLIVVARTPALRRQLRAQWTTIKSRASSRTRSAVGSKKLKVPRRSASMHDQRDVEIRLMKPDRPTARIARSASTRRSQESHTHNSIV